MRLDTPWKDEGRCAVQESEEEWSTLIERCYDALELHRIRFVDVKQVCPVAQTDVMTSNAPLLANLARTVGMCLLAQPELLIPGVIIVGTVITGILIVEAIKTATTCNCICFGIDARGKKHGPYGIGERKNAYSCNQGCLNEGYQGGGVCR